MTKNNKLKKNSNPPIPIPINLPINFPINMQYPFPPPPPPSLLPLLLQVPTIQPLPININDINNINNFNELGYMGDFKIINRIIKSDNSVWNCIFNFNNGLFEWYFDGYYTPNVYFNQEIHKNTNTNKNENINETENKNHIHKSEYKPITLDEIINLSKEISEMEESQESIINNLNQKHINKTNLERIEEGGEEEGEDEDTDDEPPPLSYFENDKEIFV